ncbi:MAG: hypothetical protein RIA65_05035 [Woeseia sp.]
MTDIGIAGLQRVVVKIGSALLIDERGALDRHWLQTLLDDVANFAANGKQVLLVSSGSVALGCSTLG